MIATVLTMSWHRRAAREVVDRLAQPLQHRPDRDRAGAALHRLVGVVAGVEVGEDEHGRAAGDRRCRAAWSRATPASTAASYWIGPSTDSSGPRSRTSAVASRTRSTSAPRARSRRSSRRASRPAARCRTGAAVCRRGDRDVGQLLGGRVRVDGAVAVDEHAVGQAHEEHARDDRDARPRLDELERRPDRVPRSCGWRRRPSRRRARARPSACRSSETSVTMSRAASSVTPLCARRCAYSCAKRSRSSASCGSRRARREMSRPSRRRGARTSAGSPSSVSVDDVAAQQHVGGAQDALVGALGQHDVPAVARARGRAASYSNISGVTRRASAPSRAASSSSSPSTCVSKSASAVSILRGAPGVIAPDGARPPAMAVSYVSCCGEDHGRHRREALDQAQDRVRRAQAAGQDHARTAPAAPLERVRRTATPSSDVGAVAGRDHERAVVEALEQVRQRHRGDHEARSASRLEQLAGRRRSARPSHAAATSPTVGAISSSTSGQHVDGQASRPASRARSSATSGVHAVGDDRRRRSQPAAAHRRRARCSTARLHLVVRAAVAGHDAQRPAARG